MPLAVEFYWDPVSPYVNLAWTQLAAFIQETRVELWPRPVLFAGLLEAHGQLTMAPGVQRKLKQ